MKEASESVKAKYAELADVYSIAYRELNSKPECTARELLSRYSELEGHTQYAIELIYGEFCREFAKQPSISTTAFLERYPEYSTQLRRMFSVHSGIVDSAVLDRLDEIRWPNEGETHGDFELIERIGRGAFSSVFLARQLSVDGRDVVVKLTANSQGEVAALSRLNHSNIVPIYTVSSLEPIGLNAICMPFFGRVTLFDVLQAAHLEGSTPDVASELLSVLPFALDPADANDPDAEAWNETFGLFVTRRAIQLLEALEVSHRLGVFHCDLKPSNVLIDNRANARLIDFNLAQTSGEGRSGGTLPYMAPEQLRVIAKCGGDQSLSAQTDLYGWAVTIGQLLSGELPHINSDDLARFEFHQPESAKTLLSRQEEGIGSWCERYREMAPELVDAIQHAMALDASERPTSAGELAERLKEVVSLKQAAIHEHNPRVSSASRFTRSNLVLMSAGLILIFSIGVTLKGVLSPSPKDGSDRVVSEVATIPYFEVAVSDFKQGNVKEALGRYDLRLTTERYEHSLEDFQEISFYHSQLVLTEMDSSIGTIGSINAWNMEAQSLAARLAKEDPSSEYDIQLVPTRLNWVCYLLNRPESTHGDDKRRDLIGVGKHLERNVTDERYLSAYKHALARWHFESFTLASVRSRASIETARAAIHEAIQAGPRVDDVYLDAASIELVAATFPNFNDATKAEFETVRNLLKKPLTSIASADRQSLIALVDKIENTRGTQRLNARLEFLASLRKIRRSDSNLMVPSERQNRLLSQ